MRSLRINAFQIHEWLHDTLRLNEGNIRVIQIHAPLLKVYVKFVDSERMMRVLQSIQGDIDFYHEPGEISIVTVAGVRIRRVRVSTLHPEVTEDQLKIL